MTMTKFTGWVKEMFTFRENGYTVAMAFQQLIVEIQWLTLTKIGFLMLTTRVKGPDIDDWRKLCHLVEYLRSTRGLPLILAADGTGVLNWYVDASFAVHPAI